jgi:hypothetical protein
LHASLAWALTSRFTAAGLALAPPLLLLLLLLLLQARATLQPPMKGIARHRLATSATTHSWGSLKLAQAAADGSLTACVCGKNTTR